jgi:hypothetical protein
MRMGSPGSQVGPFARCAAEEAPRAYVRRLGTGRQRRHGGSRWRPLWQLFLDDATARAIVRGEQILDCGTRSVLLGKEPIRRRE